ncbi:MAG: hypothetical protein WB608_20380, partial [Terracidiphilus sp.]
AIEERFILDVLAGYLPYKTAFNLAEPTKDGKRVDSKSAKRALARWLSLHATNVTQKVEFIVEHFAANVAPLLGGTAKGMVVTSSRAAAVRYKRAFDSYVEAHPEHQALHALVAFSGSLTGKEVKHPSDDHLEHDPFAAQDDDQFTENSMNPRQYGSDLRKVFDRPEFRVIIVANKFQTGFDQPKLCAMYLDKKIANPVEIVQTLSRLNRTAPGKDTTFVVDFVNDPQVVLDAFAKYDAGARIQNVQDPNVVYDLQNELDKAGIYTPAEVEAYTAVRFKSAAAYAAGDQAQHKELYAATSAPTQRFNDLLRTRRAEIQIAEANFEGAKTQGNEAAMKAADAQRNQSAEALQKLLDFKSGLGRFGTLYTYIAQTIDFSDASLEAFASFARLLSKRLDGVPPDQVDVSALLLTGFDIKPQDKPDSRQTDEDNLILKPVGPGGGAQAPTAVYLRQVIARLNSIFGEATPLTDKVAFVNHIADIAREDANTVAQVENNPREVAMSGNIKGTVQSAVVRAMQSHTDLAEHVMKNDHLAMAPLVALVYDMIKSGTNIDASAEDATFKAKSKAHTQKVESDTEDVDLQMLIWSANESQARTLDDALKPLLIAYGFDVHTGRSEFRGSYFIRYRYSKKTPELERDLERFFGSDPNNSSQPGAQLPTKETEKWKKLKEVLEDTKAFLAVGALLVGSVASLHEITDYVHKMFDHTPTPTLSNPAPRTDKQLQKIPLPATLVRINAEERPRHFEEMLNAQVESNLTSRGFLKKKRSSIGKAYNTNL